MKNLVKNFWFSNNNNCRVWRRKSPNKIKRTRNLRVTRNYDWNIDYQDFDYKDSQTLLQNYRAHLPFT